MFFNDKNLLITETKLNNYELDLLKSFNEFNKSNYIIKFNNNILISIHSNIYIRNDEDINLFCDAIYKYNLNYDKIYNQKLVYALNNYFLGEIKKIDDYYLIINKNIKSAMLAGGCFWCSANAYFHKKGIKNIFSGYAGGNLFMPSYEEVKKGITGHKETILIYYDKNLTSYKELLDIFFLTIDPFDDEGQFIDRGSNYTTAVFTNNIEEINITKDKIKEVEKIYGMKVKVKILDDSLFYLAEEYHQDYAQKNPEAFKKELIESGRIK